MVQASEIRDGETLKAWLDSRAEPVRGYEAALIAHRSAMRVLPVFVAELDLEWSRENALTALPALRAGLTSGVIPMDPPAHLRQVFDAVSEDLHRIFENLGTDRIPYTFKAFFALRDAVKAASEIDLIDSTEYAARSAFDAFGLGSVYWNTARVDAVLIEAENTPHFSPLWIRLETPGRYDPDEPPAMTGKTPREAREAWQHARDWLNAHPGHDFWIRWYEAALHGRPLTDDWESHWHLLTDIALIPDADWQLGAEHVARLIAEIEKKYQPERQIIIQPVTVEVTVSEVQRAVQVNRLTLPPTFEAIFGQIEIEIHRLQGINHWESEAQCEEARSLIRRLTAMAQAVQELQKSVEESSTEPTNTEAAKTKSLVELYAGHLKSWPRDNAADLTDSVWRLGLSGLSIAGLTLCGVPMTPAVMLAGALFGGKKLTDAFKAGADSNSVIGG